VEGIIDLPVVIPHTAAGIALLMVFGSQGLLGKWFGLFGINFIDSLAGIVVAMLFVSLPYLVNVVLHNIVEELSTLTTDQTFTTS
jgi:molybdate/tungstate transport system permease protein